MRIVMVCPSYPPQDVTCGVGDYTRCLAEELVRQGEQVTVVTTQQQQWSPAPPTYYRRPPRVYVPYRPYRPVGVRVYVPGFRRSGGVYVHPAVRIR